MQNEPASNFPLICDRLPTLFYFYRVRTITICAKMQGQLRRKTCRKSPGTFDSVTLSAGTRFQTPERCAAGAQHSTAARSRQAPACERALPQQAWHGGARTSRHCQRRVDTLRQGVWRAGHPLQAAQKRGEAVPAGTNTQQTFPEWVCQVL